MQDHGGGNTNMVQACYQLKRFVRKLRKKRDVLENWTTTPYQHEEEALYCIVSIHHFTICVVSSPCLQNALFYVTEHAYKLPPNSCMYGIYCINRQYVQHKYKQRACSKVFSALRLIAGDEFKSQDCMLTISTDN